MQVVVGEKTVKAAGPTSQTTKKTQPSRSKSVIHSLKKLFVRERATDIPDTSDKVWGCPLTFWEGYFTDHLASHDLVCVQFTCASILSLSLAPNPPLTPLPHTQTHISV